MTSKLETSLQRDIDQIRSKVIEMGNMAEQALEAGLEAIRNNNRQQAYSVVLRDRYIDEMERELDKLCQEFLVRQQPAGAHLRFVYAVIKINNELERIGDYAESIARHFLNLSGIEPQPSYDNIINIANHSIPMVRNALQSFVNEDAKLAKQTMKLEGKVDDIRTEIHDSLVTMREKDKLPLEALAPLMIITSRFERAADQACNICEEVLFMTTGKNIKHKDGGTFRVLFVDEHDACRGQIAEGIGNALGQDRFSFSSAGISPHPVDEKTIKFMQDKGIDISDQESKYVNQILNLENYELIITLCKEVEAAFPGPSKTVYIPWQVDDPSKLKGSKEEVETAYLKTYEYLDKNIRDLVEAILGNESK